jgi:hypothetical protein
MVRLTVRVLVVLALLAGIAAAGFVLWLRNSGSPWLERTVRGRINTAVVKASVPGYHFTMDSLRADARTGDLVVTGVELMFDSCLLDSLRGGEYRYLFAAKAARIELRGLSLWKLLVEGEFRVDAFVLDDPELSYYVNGRREDMADPFMLMGGHASGGVALVSADTLSVRGANATMHDLSEHLPVLSVSGLDLVGSGVRVTRGAVRSGVRLVVVDAHMRLDSIGTQLPDGGRLHIGAIRLSRRDHTGHFSAITFTPPPSDPNDVTRPRATVITATIDSIEVTGLDLDRAITTEELRLGRMSVQGMHVGVELDQALPFDTTADHLLPPAALAALPLSVRIDTLDLVEGEVLYRERNATTRRWGSVPFTALRARFLEIDNDPASGAEGSAFNGEFSGTLFRKGHLSGTYRVTAGRPGRFSIGASLTDLPLTELNTASRPLLRMEVDGGTLHRMTLRMDGNAQRAKGSLSLDYEGFLLHVEPGTPSDVRHSLFGGMLSTLQEQAYGGGLTSVDTRNIAVERDPRRSIFNYVWRFTREGLVRHLRPEMRERLRTVLRTDAEKRRQERAARKGRKSAPAQ